MIVVAYAQHLGEVVKAERQRRGWSQLDVAARGGPSDTLVSAIEAGVWSSRAPRKTMDKLDRAFGWPDGTGLRVFLEQFTPSVGPPVEDAGYVSKADPTAGTATSEQDNAVLRAVNEMRAAVESQYRDLSERVERLERRAESVEGAEGTP